MKTTPIRDDGEVYICHLCDVDQLMEQLEVKIKFKPVGTDAKPFLSNLTARSGCECIEL